MSSLTWEPVIVKVTQAGDAFPKVCVVGTVPVQDQLLLQGPLRKQENRRKKRKTKQKTELKTQFKNQSWQYRPSSAHSWTGNTWAESQAPRPDLSPGDKMSPLDLGSMMVSNNLRRLLLGRRTHAGSN